MKKKFILAIFGVSLLFTACQHDSLYDDSVIDDKKSSVLREMKTLINDNYNEVTLLDWERTLKGHGATRSGGECNSLMLTKEDFGFDWDNADVVTSNLAEAVIVPVKLNRDIALRSVVMEGNRRKKETTPIQSMLYACKIYKTGKTRAYILSFAPDRDYINECEGKGEELKLCPNPQGTNFSGILFYSTIYGEVSHGIRYEHGRKRYYIIPRSERNIGFIEQYHSEHCDNHECDSTYSHVKMAVEFITIATTTRSTYSNNSEGAEMLTCSFCGKDVEECTCVVIVACGICKKDPCECNNGDDNVEAKCDYCGFPLEYCQCNNSPEPEPNPNPNPEPDPEPTPEPKPDPKPDPTPSPGGSGSEKPKIPCQTDDGLSGNPLVDMQIAPPNNWNPKGGTWGITRYDGNGNRTVFHQGIDLAAAEGTPIYSTHDGEVIKIRNDFDNDTYRKYEEGDYTQEVIKGAKSGNFIEIKSSINGKTFTHVYWHLQKNNDNDIKVGDIVYAGTFIGYSGITGNASPTVPHLHYGIRVDGEGYVNPIDYIAADYEKDSNGNTTINLVTDCE